jgi:hypothetical protein
MFLSAVLVAGCLLAACGAPSAAQQFRSANVKLATVWSRYYDGTAGEQGLTALGWQEGTTALTIAHVNEWLSRSKYLTKAIAQYDAALGPLAATSPYRSALEKLISADSTLIADLEFPNNQRGSKTECINIGCFVFPLGGDKWGNDLLAAQEDETIVYADFGMANTAGGPYAPAY